MAVSQTSLRAPGGSLPAFLFRGADRSALRANIPAILLFGTSGVLLAVTMLHGSRARPTGWCFARRGCARRDPRSACRRGPGSPARTARRDARLGGHRVAQKSCALVGCLDRLVAVSRTLVGVCQPVDRVPALPARRPLAGATTRRCAYVRRRRYDGRRRRDGGLGPGPPRSLRRSPTTAAWSPACGRRSGYRNGLAFVLALGVPLALWVASNQSLRRPLRAAGGALAASLLIALFLTYSRSGLLGGRRCGRSLARARPGGGGPGPPHSSWRSGWPPLCARSR